MRRRMLRMFVFGTIVVFGLSPTVLQGQNNPYNEVTISAPTAASLGKYADIPISYHTGIPQINIPIYTIKEGPLQLPISLSYHASGMRVLEPAGWTGAGWSLDAGGVITRTVRGAPDERGTSSVDNQYKGHLSDSGYNSYAFIPVDSDKYTPNFVFFEDYYFAKGELDGEPDIFTFNFGGYSGKFYFHDDGTPITVPSQDLKIEYVYTGVGSIEKFIITTPDGTKYYFGKTDSTTDVDPIERTNPFTAQSGFITGTVISSWFLNKIVSPDGVFSINLYYAAENYGCFTISTYPVMSGNRGDADPNNDYEYQLVKDLVSGVRLSQITFSYGKVDFLANTVRADLSGNGLVFADDANSQAKALDTIKIWDGGTNCKKYLFSYGYFDDNVSALPGYFSNYSIISDKKRLKLLAVQEISCDGTVSVSPYNFDYFTEFVPRRLSFGQDHWGFINGVTTNTSLIPTYFLNDTVTVVGADRDSHWPAMRGGALQRIHYPTGGISEFEFEPNYTWVSYSRKQLVNTYYLTAGYDGGSSPVTYYRDFSGAPYKFVFTNSNVGSQAIINILNSGGQTVYGTVLEVGQSAYTIFNFPAGTYQIVMQKLSAVSGNGAAAHIDEFTTVATAKNDTVGGLRIKKLYHDPGNLPTRITTSYSYEKDGKSTGVLYTRPVYVSQLRNDIVKMVGMSGPSPESGPYCSPNGCLFCDPNQDYFKSGSGIRPMETTQGNHIGYSEVKVSQGGNGYTIYKYFSTPGLDTIVADVVTRTVNTLGCDPKTPSYPYAPLPYDYKRGELKSELYYDESGQLKKEINRGPTFAENSLTTPAMIMTNSPWTELGTFYELRTAKKFVDTIVETVFEKGSQQTKTTLLYHESPYHNEATRSHIATTSGDILETKTKYAMDFRVSYCDSISDCFGAYQSEAAAANYQFALAYGSCSTQYCKYYAWDLYRKRIAIARNNYIHCRTNYLTGSSGFKACMTNAKNGADAQLKPVLELREIFENAPIEVSSWRNSQLLSASFTNFDYAANPAGKVYPAKTQQINLASPSASFTPSNTSSNDISITKDSRYEDESIIKFNGGNLSEVKPKSGITLNYIWDYSNNLPIAKVTNSSASQAAYTSFEADGSGNWNIGSVLRTSGDGITGKQCYQLSNGAISKSGLTSTQYYVISYWTKNASAFTITGTQGAVLKGKTVNGWTYFEHNVTGVTQVTISGAGLLDELRLYPSQAQMITYTYEPLNGITSQCDVNNVITFYEYDSLRRLKLIKDQDKNVIKTIDYKYQSSQ